MLFKENFRFFLVDFREREFLPMKKTKNFPVKYNIESISSDSYRMCSEIIVGDKNKFRSIDEIVC